MLQVRVDWRYALSLSPDDAGFDFSILSDFRERVLKKDVHAVLLDPLLQICRERGWLKERGKQRTNSTIVLAQVRALNSLEAVGESVRALLNAVADREPDWLMEHLNPSWFDRYVHRFELARFPKEESKRAELIVQVGRDAWELLEWVTSKHVPESLSDLPEVGVLRQMVEER